MIATQKTRGDLRKQSKSTSTNTVYKIETERGEEKKGVYAESEKPTHLMLLSRIHEFLRIASPSLLFQWNTEVERIENAAMSLDFADF